MTAEGHKVRDEGGGHLVDLRVTFDVRFPEGPDGDRAREFLPRAMQQTHDRICTVSPDRRARRAGRVRRRRGGPLMARAARPGPWTDVPRQDGRTFVVTGASGGLGLETARILAAPRCPTWCSPYATRPRGRRPPRPCTGDVEVRDPRCLRPGVGARFRRGVRSGGRADQQRGRHGGAVRHQPGRRRDCTSRPTTSATSR